MGFSLFLPETIISLVILILLGVSLTKHEEELRWLDPLMVFAGLALVLASVYALGQEGKILDRKSVV